ncbi:MAG: hypothetical protein K0Q50_217 [Vampirovibrio sp.]|jgi:hypothetical protein|nr:hypothetical protein [Vampirovibrio sp.]
MSWLTIDTAPKDGKRIIGGEWRTVKAYTDHKGNLITPERTFFVQYYCRWYTTEQLQELENTYDLEDDDPFFKPGFCEEGPGDMYDEVAVKCNPTHWAPILPPPEV